MEQVILKIFTMLRKAMYLMYHNKYTIILKQGLKIKTHFYLFLYAAIFYANDTLYQLVFIDNKKKALLKVTTVIPRQSSHLKREKNQRKCFESDFESKNEKLLIRLQSSGPFI